ncbi:MAG: beta-galactosidase trimerization domain-containing protein [Candidatus Hydrogenedentes bacterium]|nr:beta-galactosidase trimerization domain-containing protein [Candidatus Hydrogenedentota bacterium]
MSILTFIIISCLVPINTQTPNWHENGFFGIHFDLHPNAKDTELGKETNPEQIRDFLLKVKPDFVQYDCKGHPGYTGYPTKIGSPSPGIVQDALRIWRDVTKELGIPLSIHYSGVWDSRAIELNPDWGRKKSDGSIDPNNTCRTSDYDTQLMIPQLIEVIKEYDIDGIWVDGENWASFPCWCERCRKKFTESTGIQNVPTKREDPFWEEWVAFHRNLFTEHVKRVVEEVHKVKPSCMVCSNWLYTMRQPEPIVVDVDYLSGDFSPSFGAKEASFEARFLASRGKPWDLMAWSFLHSQTIGKIMKTVPHLCQELSVVMAQGGSVFIYDNPKRSGRLVDWHTPLLSTVGEFCKARKEWCFKSETIPQVAVLHSETTFYKENDPLYGKHGIVLQPVEGAVSILLELGFSVDILNEDTLIKVIDNYPLVVIPERKHLTPNFVSKVKEYVNNGGNLILSGNFLTSNYGDWLNGTSEKTMRRGWLPLPDGSSITTGGEYECVRTNQAKIIAFLLNGEEPDKDATQYPAVSLHEIGKGKVLAIYGPFFRLYSTNPVPQYRTALNHWLSELDTTKLARHTGPWYLEFALRKKDNKLLLNLVNRGVSGYLSPERHMVEDVPAIENIAVYLPLTILPANKQIEKAYLAPDLLQLQITNEGNRLKVSIPKVNIYDIGVLEVK